LLGLWLIIAGINAVMLARFVLSLDHGLAKWLLIASWFIWSSQILIGVGLLCRAEFARVCALGWAVWTWVFLAGQAILLICLGSNPLISGSSMGLMASMTDVVHGTRYLFLVVPLPMIFVPIISLFNAVFLLWAYHFLNRPQVRRLFEPESECVA
jgi:hypothetical protein